MSKIFVAFILLVLSLNAYAYKSVIRSNGFSVALNAWDRNRTPCPNMKWLDQRMDATWGRGKFRTEVWEDNVNPMNDWWETYAPSEEEIEAISQGYDFGNPKAWFEEQGIDADKAFEEGNKVKNERFQTYLQEKAQEKPVTEEEFQKLKTEYFALQKKVFESAFRLNDNRLQAAKGQPSLDSEDTGVQWKNDP